MKVQQKHFESIEIMNITREELINGKKKGTKILFFLLLQMIMIMLNYIKLIEDEGYNVRAQVLPCEVNDNMCQNIGRELVIGRLINNYIVFYNKNLKKYIRNLLIRLIQKVYLMDQREKKE